MSEPEPAKAKANKSNKAAEKSDVNNLLGRTGQDRDFLYGAQNKTAFSGESSRMQWDPAAKALRLASSGRSGKGSYTSPLIRCKFPATEFLPSWNISLGDTAAQSSGSSFVSLMQGKSFRHGFLWARAEQRMTPPPLKPWRADGA